MRGREPPVSCDNCGRTVPRNKAVTDEKVINLGTDANEGGIRFMTRRKVYYCISCAKHKGIFEKKKHQAERAAERGYRY
jgi:ribosomal protein S26